MRSLRTLGFPQPDEDILALDLDVVAGQAGRPGHLFLLSHFDTAGGAAGYRALQALAGHDVEPGGMPRAGDLEPLPMSLADGPLFVGAFAGRVVHAINHEEADHVAGHFLPRIESLTLAHVIEACHPDPT